MKKSKTTPEPEVSQLLYQSHLNADDPLSLQTQVTIMELREHICRWPVGDPKSVEFRYCGALNERLDCVYCERHAAIAYNMIRNVR